MTLAVGASLFFWRAYAHSRPSVEEKTAHESVEFTHDIRRAARAFEARDASAAAKIRDPGLRYSVTTMLRDGYHQDPLKLKNDLRKADNDVLMSESLLRSIRVEKESIARFDLLLGGGFAAIGFVFAVASFRHRKNA